jgi:biotin/methionine sulfoxide reductase
VYDRVRASATAKGVTLPGFQQFWAEGFVELPPPERDYVLFEDFRRDPEGHPLKTPSGRIEIMSDAVKGFDYADCPPHATWIPPAEWLGNAGPGRFHLVTHQPAGKLHSQMDAGPVSRAQKVAGREAIRLNPTDAAKHGIGDGDLVRVFNTRGACLAGALLDPGVIAGVVVMATGSWFDPSGDPEEPERHGNPNVLTLDIGTSTLAQGTSALTALVEIEPYAGPAPDVRVFTPPRLAAVG